MQIYYDFFISATISSPNMTRDSNELRVIVLNSGSSSIACGPAYSSLVLRQYTVHYTFSSSSHDSTKNYCLGRS